MHTINTSKPGAWQNWLIENAAPTNGSPAFPENFLTSWLKLLPLDGAHWNYRGPGKMPSFRLTSTTTLTPQTHRCTFGATSAGLLSTLQGIIGVRITG
jgi:hypothetical protein